MIDTRLSLFDAMEIMYSNDQDDSYIWDSARDRVSGILTLTD
jgi:hypothetical protein